LDETTFAVDSAFLRSPKFSRLSIDDQERIVYSNLHYYERGDNVASNDPWDWIRNMFTTIVLRANCGCVEESIVDETTGETIALTFEHNAYCQRIRLPITEDLADSTILRRARKQVSLSECLEDKLHG
jgi:hypothetical protein